MSREIDIELEKAVVRALVDHCGKFGWHAIEVDDGGEEPAIKRTYDVGLSADEVVEAAFAVDEARIIFSNGERRSHWVALVFGNSPEEVIADYSYGPISNPDDFEVVMEEFDAEEAITAKIKAAVTMPKQS